MAIEPTADEIIKDRLNQMPPVIRRVIEESNWEQKIRNIVTRHNLRVDQGSAIEGEAQLVMLGLVSADEFFQNIKREAELDEETTTKVVSDVNNEIFKFVRQELQKQYEKKGENRTEKEGEKSKPPVETVQKSIDPENVPKYPATAPHQPAESLKSGVSENSPNLRENESRQQIINEVKEIEDDIEIIEEHSAQSTEQTEPDDIVGEKLSMTTASSTENLNPEKGEKRKERRENTSTQNQNYSGIDPYREPIN